MIGVSCNVKHTFFRDNKQQGYFSQPHIWSRYKNAHNRRVYFICFWTKKKKKHSIFLTCKKNVLSIRTKTKKTRDTDENLHAIGRLISIYQCKTMVQKLVLSLNNNVSAHSAISRIMHRFTCVMKVQTVSVKYKLFKQSLYQMDIFFFRSNWTYANTYGNTFVKV